MGLAKPSLPANSQFGQAIDWAHTDIDRPIMAQLNQWAQSCTIRHPPRSIEMNDDAFSQIQFKAAAEKEEIELQRIMLLTVRNTPIFCPNKTHSKPPNRICRASLAVERKPKNPFWKFNLPFKR